MSFEFRLTVQIKVPKRRVRNVGHGRTLLKLTKKEWASMEKVKDAMWNLMFNVNDLPYCLYKIEDVASETPTLILR